MLTPKEWVEAALEKYRGALEDAGIHPETDPGMGVLHSLLAVLEEDEKAGRRQVALDKREQLFKEMDEPDDEWNDLLTQIDEDSNG